MREKNATIAIINRGEFYARETGSPSTKSPALLVHGLGVNSDMWQPVLSRLATDRPVFRYDLRGHGRSIKSGADYSLKTHAEDLIALCRRLSADQKLHVVGTSLGGVIVQIAAANQPDLFQSLVLSSTFCAAPQGLDGHALAQALAEATNVRAFYEPIVKRSLPANQMWIEPILQAIEACDREALIQGTRELFTYQGSERLSAISCPCLIVTGDMDEYFSITCAQEIAARLNQARIKILQGVGHAPYLESPVAFSEEILAFWRSLPGQ
jgi:aminoacrylate hydrolase